MPRLAFPANALAFAPTAHLLLVGGGGGPARSGVTNAVAVIRPPSSSSPQSRKAAAECSGASTNDADDSDAVVRPLHTHAYSSSDDAPWCCAVNPSETMVLVGVSHHSSQNKDDAPFDKSCELFDFNASDNKLLKSRATLNTLQDSKSDYLCACSFSPDSTHIATGSDAGILCVAKISSRTPEILSWCPLALGTKVFDAFFSSDSSTIYAITPRAIRAFDVASGAARGCLEPQENYYFRAGKPGPENTIVCAINWLRKAAFLHRYDAANFATSPPKNSVIAYKPCVSMAVRGTISAFGMADFSVILFDGLRRVRTIPSAHSGPVTALALGAAVLYTASSDREVKAWPVAHASDGRPWVIGVIFLILALAALLAAYVLPLTSS